jgi:hypothetical protein
MLKGGWAREGAKAQRGIVGLEACCLSSRCRRDLMEGCQLVTSRFNRGTEFSLKIPGFSPSREQVDRGDTNH